MMFCFSALLFAPGQTLPMDDGMGGWDGGRRNETWDY